jgi:hypothetical protein
MSPATIVVPKIAAIKIAATARRLPALLAALSLLTVGWDQPRAFAQQPAEAPAAAAPAVLPMDQVDVLVAPIALYPDNLLGQVLTASTYPLEIVMAARWASGNANLKGQALEDAMQNQPWDPSVKALTAVPQVLTMMNDKLDWTKQLGEAYLAQPDDIATAVQRLRARADASGNLKPSNDVRVRRVAAPPPVVVGAPVEPEYIVIEPVAPDVMYVPVYDPFLVYGVWPYPAYRPFYWYPPGYVAVGVFAFGAPIVVGAALWANYNWRSRRVDVNVTRFNAFNRVHITSTSWSHDPGHRGSIAYSNPGLQQRFGKTNTGGNQQFFGSMGGGTGVGKAAITGTGGGNNLTINKNVTINNNNNNNNSKTTNFKQNNINTNVTNLNKNNNITNNTNINKNNTITNNSKNNLTVNKNATLNNNFGKSAGGSKTFSAPKQNPGGGNQKKGKM